jgi:hypothetical protein
MNIAGLAADGINMGKHLVLKGGTTQEFILIGSFVVLGVVLLSCALGFCSRCRSHPSSGRYTSKH